MTLDEYWRLYIPPRILAGLQPCPLRSFTTNTHWMCWHFILFHADWWHTQNTAARFLVPTDACFWVATHTKVIPERTSESKVPTAQFRHNGETCLYDIIIIIIYSSHIATHICTMRVAILVSKKYNARRSAPQNRHSLVKYKMGQSVRKFIPLPVVKRSKMPARRIARRTIKYECTAILISCRLSRSAERWALGYVHILFAACVLLWSIRRALKS
jgi:hypothetical protein